MPTVFIIDEEYHFAENVASILRIEGYQARRFPDATEAYRFFVDQPNDASLKDCRLLVDVSLAPGDNRDLFGPDATDGFMTTGMVLVTQLSGKLPQLCRADNTVLYTAHYTTNLWDKIVTYCEAGGFKSWQKRADAEPDDIISLIRDQ